MTNGGAIPDQFDYDVVLMPESCRRHAQRGLRLRKPARRHLPARQHVLSDPAGRDRPGVRGGRARPAAEYSVLVRRGAGAHATSCPQPCRGCASSVDLRLGGRRGCRASLAGERRWGCRRPRRAAASTTWPRPAPRSACCRPARTLIFERFFDEVGDTHLVMHSPFGSRLNRAWGLALRKRFCRQFNFELQAAATGRQHRAVAGPDAQLSAGRRRRATCAPRRARRADPGRC